VVTAAVTRDQSYRVCKNINFIRSAVFWAVTLSNMDKTRRFGGSLLGNVRWELFPRSDHSTSI
jgi:hypothetical protein